MSEKKLIQKTKIIVAIFTTVLDVAVIIIANYVAAISQGMAYTLVGVISSLGLTIIVMHTKTDQKVLDLKIEEVRKLGIAKSDPPRASTAPDGTVPPAAPPT